jgi:hypothetical protein
MCSPTEYFLDSYKSNDQHIVNEEKECRGNNGTTVTPYILEEWKKNMTFWKNHDICRRIFNVSNKVFTYKEQRKFEIFGIFNYISGYERYLEASMNIFLEKFLISFSTMENLLMITSVCIYTCMVTMSKDKI